MTANTKRTGPDLSAGLPLDQLAEDAWIAGHVGKDSVLLSRFNGELSAVGGACTHYGGPLAEGLVVGETVRCPWHHACFSLRTGEAFDAPAFDRLERWAVEVEGSTVFVRKKLDAPAPKSSATGGRWPNRIVIVGGGAAGFAAAEMLRRRGYAGTLTMLSADDSPPCDRPNLSKDYLAGTASEAWIPLKGEDFYRDHAIDLRLGAAVSRLDAGASAVFTASGDRFDYDALLLATGAEPIRLDTPGFERSNVHTLRSLSDSRAIVAAAKGARSLAVIGASFIGLEVAAALRTRGLAVHVVAPDAVPMARVLGEDLGRHIRGLHEAKGVAFHLDQTATGYDGRRLQLSSGEAIEVDFLVVGVGVRPRIELAKAAGLAVDNGVLVDAFLETSVPGIFAAGDIACYPDPRSDERIRVEHWVAAERQGQLAAVNMLGHRRPMTSTPFFWSQHYDLAVRYVGHASGAPKAVIDGSIENENATIRFLLAEQLQAAASVGRDHQNLEIAAALEWTGVLSA
jgi:NADPH-dependent 2,4-dienoyl-CoA reductase/sulfur reductase-like enzyme/nitrite reductase/ring-hydroxylating ferredoxin subunit